MRALTPLRMVFLLLAIFLSEVLAQPPLVNDSNCNCFLINGSSPTFFSQHNFFDFRSLSKYANTPAVIQTAPASADAQAPSNYFTQKDWDARWAAQTWNNSGSIGSPGGATILMVNSLNNVYIQKNSDTVPGSQTYLTLRTVRLGDFQSSAEIETVSGTYQFASIRMLARTVGPPGAVTSLFTLYENSTGGDVQEADLEIRTQDPVDSVQYTNQPGYTASGEIVPGATRNATTPQGTQWSDWAIYRLDWTPGNVTWYLNGQMVVYNSFQVPTDPSEIHLNTWSNGGSWSGNMSVNEEAYLQIQWFDMVFNSTEPITKRESTTHPGAIHDRRDDDDISPTVLMERASGSGGCEAVCSIDETTVIGTPVLLSGTPAASSSSAEGWLDKARTSITRAVSGVLMLAVWTCFV